MRFRVTILDPKTGQKAEKLVVAADERAAGWAVLQGGGQLLSVEPLGGSPASAAQPAPPRQPAKPPNHRIVMCIVWALLGVGGVLTIWALPQLMGAMSQVSVAQKEWEPVEKQLDYLKKGGHTYYYEDRVSNKVLQRLNEAKGARNRALNWLGGGVALLAIGGAIWAWLWNAQRMWTRWQQQSGATAPAGAASP
jgi:hypothetical protein